MTEDLVTRGYIPHLEVKGGQVTLVQVPREVKILGTTLNVRRDTAIQVTLGSGGATKITLTRPQGSEAKIITDETIVDATKVQTRSLLMRSSVATKSPEETDVMKMAIGRQR